LLAGRDGLLADAERRMSEAEQGRRTVQERLDAEDRRRSSGEGRAAGCGSGPPGGATETRGYQTRSGLGQAFIVGPGLCPVAAAGGEGLDRGDPLRRGR